MLKKIFKLTILIFTINIFIFNPAKAAPLPTLEYACIIATYGDYLYKRQDTGIANRDKKPILVNAPGPIALEPAGFMRVPCGDPVFLDIYRRTGNGLLGVAYASSYTAGAYNDQYSNFPAVIGWSAFVIEPGDDLSVCITKKPQGIAYASCSKGQTSISGVAISNGNQVLNYDFTISTRAGDTKLNYGCKSNKVGGVILDVPCDWPIANLMYSSANPNSCISLSPSQPVYAAEGGSPYHYFFAALASNPPIACPVTQGYSYVCSDANGMIDCNESARLAWSDNKTTAFAAQKASDNASAMCPGNDPNCLFPGRNVRAVPYADKGDMVIYPKSYRPDALSLSNSANPADAILAQTSYLARVMIQANDIFPPSHVSTRSSGESYASTVLPINYNIKALTQVSAYRNGMGATNTSTASLSSSTAPVNRETVIRDWVEYHINQYCDPLAGSIGAKGLNDCNVPLGNVNRQLGSNAALLQNSKQEGKTAWDLVVGNGQTAPYAADITANTLFSTKADYPEASMRYIYNLTNIQPSPLTSAQTTFTVPEAMLAQYNGKTVLKNDGYKAYMNYIEEQSKLSLSQFALMKIFADRLQLDNIKIPVTKWDKDGKQQVTYETTSRHGLLEFETTKRFSDPAWYDRVQQMPTPALLKEIAYMMSMQLALDFKRYEQDQLQTALTATFTSDMSRLVKYMREIQGQQQAAAQNGDPMSQLQNLINQYQTP